MAFRTLISKEVLIIGYFLGAIVMPLFVWLASLYLMRRYLVAAEIYQTGKALFFRTLPLRYRLLGMVLFLMSFLFMELMWRLMFEYLIAFMQMRDALIQ